MSMIDKINLRWKQIFHLLKKSSRPILDELGLTKVDANILLVLCREKVKSKGELAHLLSFKPNSLTRSLDRLIGLDLVKRVTVPEDQRCIRVSLTDKGQLLAKQYCKNMRGFWQQAFEGMDKQEVAVFETALEKIFFNLSRSE